MELLNDKRKEKVEAQLALLGSAGQLKTKTEERIASLAYVNSDYTSAMAFISGLLGAASILLALATTNLDLALNIILGIVAGLLALISGFAGWKLFNRDTPRQVAFEIHQARCADLKHSTTNAKLLNEIKKLRQDVSFQGGLKAPATLKIELKTALYLSIFAAVVITARRTSR